MLVQKTASMRVLFFLLTWQLIAAATPASDSPSGTPSDTVRKMNFTGLEPYLHRQSDTVYVVNFWATWCGPCREELPDLEQIHKDYSDAQVKVLLVSLDFPSAAEKSLIPFIRDNDITADVILLDDPDANAWIDKVDPSWSGALPATLVYNRGNRIFFGNTVSYETVDQAISGLLVR